MTTIKTTQLEPTGTQHTEVNTYYKEHWHEICPGWNTLIEPLVKYCVDNNVKIHQIKEKFGGLRFYTGEAPAEFRDMVRKAEAYSEHMCEICGQPGELRTNTSWWRTVCDEHNKRET